MAISQLKGPRLPYAVIPLKGKVKVTRHGYDRKNGKVITTETEEDAGWLVGFPDGHYLRIRRPEDMRRYQLNKKPRPIAADGMILHPTEKPDDTLQNMEADIWAMVKKTCGRVEIPGYTGKIAFPERVVEEDYA